MGSTIQNAGVEDGAQAIADFFVQNHLLSETLTASIFVKKFEAPEQITPEAYLETTFKKYHETIVKLLNSWHQNKSLITFGGDHSISYISLAAVLERYGAKNTCVLMFDSHADLNSPESSATGNFHGMWLRAFFDSFEKFNVTNHKITPSQLRYIGNLILDQAEVDFIQEHAIKVYSSDSASHMSAQEVLTWTKNFNHLHISFDIDVFSQRLVSATGTPNPDGFNLEQVMIFLEAVKNHPSISLDIVEFNPKKEGYLESLEIIKKVFTTLIKH
jgi:arginase